jgi:hypothetical protein
LVIGHWPIGVGQRQKESSNRSSDELEAPQPIAISQAGISGEEKWQK